MTTSTHIANLLIIEDDEKLALLTKEYLSKKGFSVSHAEDGLMGINLAKELEPELIILDLMLPKVDGLTACRELKRWYRGPLLILTASEEDMDQVAALEMGADDYVSKPIHPRVLLARIRMLLRRYGPEPSLEEVENKSNELSFGKLYINFARRQVLYAKDKIQLSEGEFELLWLLASHPEQTLSREEISQCLRGIEHDGLDRSIDNKIVSLRRKLNDNQGPPRRIITVRGKGYVFITDQW